MSLEVSVVHEARWTRVTIKGNPGLGRLLSLLHVMEVDSASWPRAAVLVDLRPLQTRLGDDEQARFAWEAAGALRRMKKVALVGSHARMREGPGLRRFEHEAEAQRWLDG